MSFTSIHVIHVFHVDSRIHVFQENHVLHADHVIHVDSREIFESRRFTWFLSIRVIHAESRRFIRVIHVQYVKYWKCVIRIFHFF